MAEARRHAMQHSPLNHGPGQPRARGPFSKSEPLKNRYPGTQGFVIARTGHASLLPEKG
jgi:hypothetical protein